MDAILVDYSNRKLEQLAGRITDCLSRLTEEQVWIRGNDNQNAIGNLVLHLCGNVRQWIISGVGGQPDVRQRDAEFAARGNTSIPELTARLTQTVGEAQEVIRGLTAPRFTERVRIQAYDVTVLEAVLHVLEHFSHHTGQIIFATKLVTGADLGYYAHLNRPKHGQATP